MKKLLLILTSLAIVIAAGLATLAVVYKYENVQEQKAHQERQERADMNRSIAESKWKLEDANTALKGEYNALHAQCVKGNAAYDLLSITNQRQVENPACGSTK